MKRKQPRAWLSAGTVERVIDAPAAVVYRLITDLDAAGGRSPECSRLEWLKSRPEEPVVGARFRGHNRARLARWSRICEVVEALPEKTFAFRTVPARFDITKRDSTTWRYELVADGSRTLVRHSYKITVPPLRPLESLYGVWFPHHRDMRPAMEHTLEVLAEQTRTSEEHSGLRGADAAPAPGTAHARP
jgi:hypothetical protein